MKKLYNIIILLFAHQLSYAQQGILDTSFGDNGIQRASKLMYYNDTGHPRGTVKVIFNSTGSSTYLGNDLVNGGVLPVIRVINQDVSLKVWNKKTIVKDGIMDTNNGLFSTGYTQKEDNNKAIYVSKIKYGNITNSTGQGFSLDNNFNYDGKIVFDTKEVDEEGIAIKLQSDNKIVILGYSGTKGIVIRYNSDGYLDRTFNQKGFHTFQIAQNTKPTSFAIQTDGKIVVAGNCFNGNDIDFFITRLNTNGTIDNSFGTNGIVIKDVNNHDNTGNAMVLANDGNIFIGGKSYTKGGAIYLDSLFSYNYSLFKYNQNGTLATAYTNGILTGAFIISASTYVYGNPNTIVPNNEEVNCMAYDYVNNRIYLSGYAYAQDNITKTPWLNIGVSTVNATYVDASSFQYPPGYIGYSHEVIASTIKPSDMILGNSTPLYTVVKFSNCSYGTSTFLNTPTSTVPASCYNNLTEMSFAKIQKTNDGYYGSTNYNGSGDLYKLDSNFVVDSNFGINGKIANIKEFKIDNDGKIICTGISQTNGTRTLLARFNSDGQVDNTFGTLGEIRTQNLWNTFGIYVTPENDYIVSSYRVNNSNPQIRLEKYLNNGEKDQSFNSPVLLNVNNSLSSYPNLINSEDIISDNLGNIYTIAFNYNYNTSNPYINLAKINSNGIIDSNFGINGIVNLVPFFNQPSEKFNLIRLNNEKILAYSDKRMIQINNDGTLDATFGTNGIIDGNTILSELIISKVITNGSDYFIGGHSTSPGGGKAKIIKINHLGVVDTSFATNGFYTDSDANYQNVIYGVKYMYFDGLDKIVFSGVGIPIKRIQ